MLPALLSVAVSGCYAGANRPYWAIAPVYDVRNSPIPVPRPAFRPKPPSRYASVAPPTRTVRASPKAASRASSKATSTARTVTVQRGDTVYGIARKRGVPLPQLVALNNLEPPYLLAVGQRLKIPGQRTHVVRRGDTVFSIAQRHDLEVSQLAQVNRLAPPYMLKVGQTLVVPSGRTEEMTVAARPSRSLAAPPPRTGNGFDWPVAGTVISKFGPKQGGLRNDGINIRAPKGAPVRVAESGIVAYAGSGLRGFGNLVLVRHSDDWVTAYAHNEDVLVKRGEAVKRGQMIARIGSSGGVTDPQLHFEVRRGTKAVDPLSVLPRLSANAR
ncbi:hypothetical protein JCM17844_05970 [Iodidimonas gelatinilytica]|uniref:LysM domain-containing protein n=1 Tax=Iodidimonas gelatinilytica TaxID=1236966 RepID=A0A5A7MWN7_9PROT|nr:LysM peptidoglycan-binding domain-containing protein [Iodidimonas gelatinilytica]GEQ96960.1 hypothetical protein JCM17844_05970 [Iodidimonas gelatinilytica]GER00491.1 hypothetical protein JCM17845_11140 [Iodidimonas gelatinilytica]